MGFLKRLRNHLSCSMTPCALVGLISGLKEMPRIFDSGMLSHDMNIPMSSNSIALIGVYWWCLSSFVEADLWMFLLKQWRLRTALSLWCSLGLICQKPIGWKKWLGRLMKSHRFCSCTGHEYAKMLPLPVRSSRKACKEELSHVCYEWVWKKRIKPNDSFQSWLWYKIINSLVEDPSCGCFWILAMYMSISL